MTKKEIIKAFKLAEKHYNRPEWLCKIIGWNKTKTEYDGFCFYFSDIQNFHPYEINEYLKPLWINYKTTEVNNPYDFKNRKERLQAIRMVLRDLDESLVEKEWFIGDRVAGK